MIDLDQFRVTCEILYFLIIVILKIYIFINYSQCMFLQYVQCWFVCLSYNMLSVKVACDVC